MTEEQHRAQGSARRLVIRQIVIILALIVVVVGNLWYTNYEARQAEQRAREAASLAIRESDRKWCDIVVLFDSTYRSTPPTTPAGVSIAKFFAERRVDFGCDAPR